MKVLLSNGAVVEQRQDSTPAWLALAFRPFFAGAALFSIISLLLWLAMLQGQLSLTPYGGAKWWHVHEMLYGFVSAVVVGFLLTAVQTWTQVPGLKGAKLLALVLLWLLGRLLLWLPLALPLSLIAAIDLAFLPLAALALAYPIVKIKLWRNIIFVPVLLLMALVNGLMHYSVLSQDMSYFTSASRAMVMLVTFVMCFMGGRVIPMFTANGTQTVKVAPLPWLEKLSLGSVLLLALLSVTTITLPTMLAFGLYLFAALSQFARALRWRIWVTWKVPLVWSLHLSYLCIPLGLLLLALAQISTLVSPSQALHVLTVGAMGGMILAMISRVSLGHTGRTIAVGKTMALAFIAIFAAAIIRVSGAMLFDNYFTLLTSAALCWALAYGLFIIRYTPMLMRKRVDGRPG